MQVKPSTLYPMLIKPYCRCWLMFSASSTCCVVVWMQQHRKAIGLLVLCFQWSMLITLKMEAPPTRLHSATYQKSIIFIFTIVRTSNVICLVHLLYNIVWNKELLTAIHFNVCFTIWHQDRPIKQTGNATESDTSLLAYTTPLNYELIQGDYTALMFILVAVRTWNFIFDPVPYSPNRKYQIGDVCCTDELNTENQT
jgi:hypothetical protein